MTQPSLTKALPTCQAVRASPPSLHPTDILLDPGLHSGSATLNRLQFLLKKNKSAARYFRLASLSYTVSLPRSIVFETQAALPGNSCCSFNVPVDLLEALLTSLNVIFVINFEEPCSSWYGDCFVII